MECFEVEYIAFRPKIRELSNSNLCLPSTPLGGHICGGGGGGGGGLPSPPKRTNLEDTFSSLHDEFCRYIDKESVFVRSP